MHQPAAPGVATRLRYALSMGALAVAFSLPAQAQIYECTAKDGSRVFSDKKCSADAKPVPGITTNNKKKPATSPRSAPAANQAPSKTQVKTAKTPPKSADELAGLMQLCNAGDIKSCTAWTHGGGPSSLRDRERKAEAACEAGSLPDCELRYCSDGATDECRQRVMQSAKVSGGNWYLREEAQYQDDGTILYKVRCIEKDVIEIWIPPSF